MCLLRVCYVLTGYIVFFCLLCVFGWCVYVVCCPLLFVFFVVLFVCVVSCDCSIIMRLIV